MSGQFDGDGPFSKSMQALPAFFGGTPPWHLWGNTERFGPFGSFSPGSVQGIGRQLVRVSFKRPETWRWMFAAKLMSAPSAGVAGSYQLSIDFDVTIGVGRSSFTMPGFDRLQWVWTGVGDGPTSFPIWVASAVSPPANYSFANGLPVANQTGRIIDRIVAQDIQVMCRVQFVAIDEPIGGQAELEVSAYFSPATHVRPDWLRDAPEEARFGGNEIGGT